MKSNSHQSQSEPSIQTQFKHFGVVVLAVILGLVLAGSILGVASATTASGTEPQRVVLQETQPPLETLLPTEPVTPTLLPPIEFAPTDLPPTAVPPVESPAAKPPFSQPLEGEIALSPELADLQVRTTVSPDGIRAGGQVTVTVRYTNTLPGIVSNVIISDTLNKGQVFDGVYQSTPDIPIAQFSYTGGSGAGYNLFWQIPTLAGNSSGVIIMHTTVLTTPVPDLVHPYDDFIFIGNAVDIFAPGVLGSESNANGMVIGPLFELRKATTPTAVLPGRLLTYTLTLYNKTRSDCASASNVVITDTVPSNATFVWADAGGIYDDPSRTVHWNLPGIMLCNTISTVRFGVRISDKINSSAYIVNALSAYKVMSADLPKAKNGYATINTDVLPVLEKTATDKKKSANPEAFPTEEITYTVKVNNPLDIPLSGVIVTDTMPGDPVPFTFVRATPGSPTPQIVSDGKYLVWSVNLPASGSTTFSFVVQIPRQTSTLNNITRDFYNILKATHPSTYFSPETNLARVRVKAAVQMKKIVTPTHGMNGDEVIYELTLTNYGPYPFTTVRVTDTLPAQFDYLRMDSGIDPLPAYQGKVVVWDGLPVPVASVVSLRFAVAINGAWLATYYNNVVAYSPDGYIPPLVNQAPVKVDPPMAINKTVSQSSIFINDFVEYTISIANKSQEPWTIADVTDNLPDGFYQMGGNNANLAVIPVDPDFAVPPGGTWTGSFQAQALGGGLLTCPNLPRSFPNTSGSILVYITDPVTTIGTNAVDLAPVQVKPNVNVTLTPYRQAVQPGNLITYTLSLDNVSPTNAYGTDIILNLPVGFAFEDMVQGAPPSVSGTALIWNGVDIAANTKVEFKFHVRVSPTISLGSKVPTINITTGANICFSKLTTGTVSVLADVVILKKTAPTNVGSNALVEYDLSIENKDAYPFVLPSLVDTLPSKFSYDSMTSGPAPSQVIGNQVIWYNVTIPKGVTHFKMKARSANLYGSYTNVLAASSPETEIKTFLGAVVNVLPVVDVKKDTSVRNAMPGATIPYTITMVNQSNLTYSSIVVTDTLPAGFSYLRTRTGSTPPVSLGPGKTKPVWNIPSMAPGTTKTLSFEAVIGITALPDVYYNEVTAFSPIGSIPGTGLTAPVTITQASDYIFIYLPLVRK